MALSAFLTWFVEQERFYRILLLAMVFFGLTVAITGLATANIVFVILGIIWTVGGAWIVAFAANRDPDTR